MIDINYVKRKNIDLFKNFENPLLLDLSNPQNYIPIYDKFFSLNETNFNSINLNHKWHISSLQENIDNENKFFRVKLKNINTNKTKDKSLFFKIAPLLDPYKYLIGKYDLNDQHLFNLPSKKADSKVNPKIQGENNSAYVDSFFAYLNNHLINNYNFSHGIEFFGSFLGIKNNFNLNVYDDIEYLSNSDFFVKNKNILYKIDDYEHIFDEKKPPIKINNSLKSNFSIESINNCEYGDLFENSPSKEISNLEEIESIHSSNSKSISLKSTSTCSSRSSHTSNDSELESESEESDEETSSISDESDESEEEINVSINKFPVQIIALEKCEQTLDDLMLENELSEEEWTSALMQIIMILITYQKAFSFTHNDLHTNNVMYNPTTQKFIYYTFKSKTYKVPTYGRIFKIIDFGRSIFKCKEKLFCSDSFQMGEDAATQYNTEPYFNEKKPRLEPNFSFDLCRLACSLFDFFVEDLDEIKDLEKCSKITKLIVEWCLDDKGINLLYKTNGVDRYPDFKLYKMIARCVHNHTPQAQLERPLFKQFLTNEKTNSEVINIDEIPVF